MDLEKYYDKYWTDALDIIDHKRLAFIINEIEPGQEVLEINCGLGILANKMVKKGANVTVTDMSLVALRRTSCKDKKIKVNHLDLDIHTLSFEDNKFDVIVSNSMIEHVFFPDNTIKEGVKVLKNGGKFVIMVPNIGHWRFRLWLLLGRFPYIGNTPTDTLHLRFFTSNSIKKLGEKYGLKRKKVSGSSGLWVRKLYPVIFIVPPIKQLYEILTMAWPSLFARYLLVVFKKEK